ncbi:hypothetical protein [Peribacillus simplex]|uniref:hypothetical protein n=1 Tax=Peribacillus simplex TaxID=1478 RepID=UPI00366C3CA0
MGVGGTTNKLDDYYYAYKQAMHAYNVPRNGFPKNVLAIFDSYTLLNNLKDPGLAELLLKK